MSDLQNRLKKLSPEQRAILEKKLREKALAKTESEKVRIREDESLFPMSSNQERLWFLNQLDNKSSFYNMPYALKIKGNLNVNYFEKVIKEVINRHKILNAYYSVDKNHPIQLISKNEFSLIVDDCSNNLKDLNKLIDEEAAIPFDLNKGPLYRIRLLKIANEEFILFLTLHHIVADGWSIEILINEISLLYSAYTEDKNVSLPELPIQYYDYANWKKEKYTREVENKELEFWKQKLYGMPQVIDLPYKNSKINQQTFNGDRYSFKIPIEYSDKLKEASKQYGVSPFMVYLAVLQVLLYRYSHQNDFGIGTLHADRNLPETKSLIGFFVNTLVLRARISDHLSFTEVLKNVKKEVLEINQNHQIPFEKIVDVIIEERNHEITPLFQVIYDYQIAPAKKITLPGMELDVIDQKLNSAKFNLSVVLEESNNEIEVIIEYNTDKFDDEFIVQLGNSFKTIIKEVAKNSENEVGEIEIVTQEDLENISTWNNTENEFDQESCLHDLIREISVTNPERIAVVDGDKFMTYSELNKKSDQIASYLFSNNIKHEDVVAVNINSSIKFLVSIVAIMKVGAAYLPLDPSYPKSRIAKMIEDSNANAVITLSKNKNSELDDLPKTVTYEDIVKTPFDMSINEIKVIPQNTAYYIYTSGSTGKPKGVMCNHLGVVNHIRDMQRRLQSEVPLRHSLWSSTSFDVSILEIFHALCSGGELHIVPNDIRSLGKELFKWFEEHKISFGYLPPFLVQDFCDWLQNKDNKSYLKKLAVGVEPIKLKTLSSIREKISGILIFNGYGPTETTIYSTGLELNFHSISEEITPIGKPISNTKIYLLDKNFRMVPLGVVGEIYICSIGIAKGYINNPDLTAEKFIPDPFSKIFGERIYKTGDLAKYDKNGNLIFIGRADNQVKLRGYRIELSEIENVILSYDNVEKVRVVVDDKNYLNPTLIACVVLTNINEFDQNEFKKKLFEVLPIYMIPNSIIPLESIPINSNGKINKNLLLRLIKKNNILSRNYQSTIYDKIEKYNTNALVKLTNDEKSKILTEFCAPVKQNVVKNSIVSLFYEQVVKTPKNIAVSLHGHQIDFSELNDRSNQLAKHLINSGIQNEDIVAVCLERSIESIISIFAIWKIGAAYLPVDSKHPADRVNFIISDSGAKAIITNKMLSHNLRLIHNNKILIDENIEFSTDYETCNINLDVNPENLAYLIYTSGSTGNPKGVMVQHNAALNLAFGLKERIYSHTKKKYLKISLNASLQFDASMQEIIMIIFGHTLVIIPENIRLDGKKLLNYVKSQQIDLLDCVPTQLKILLDSGLTDNTNYYPKIIMPGGEAIDKVLWEKLLSLTHLKIFNMYGPTECTVDSTICEISKKLPEPSIGRPIINSPHYILDRSLNICPIGSIGELHIGGDCLSRGYYKNPELTADKFIPNPFSESIGSRIYKTGDLVRFMNDGNIEFIGRLDDQVKLRGFRIELGEVESVIKRVEGIKDAVVLLHGKDSIEQKLVAYVVPVQNDNGIIQKITEKITLELPEYMVPKVFTLLDKFPLTSNGKIDKRSLLTMEFEDDVSEKNFAEPKNEFEKFIAEMWSEILKINNISIYDSFFDLGGNSILAAVFINRIQNELDIEVQVQSIFLAPTIKEFSNYAIEYYPDIIAKKFGENNNEVVPKLKIEKSQKLTKESFKEFSNIVTPLSAYNFNKEVKNPSAIFILSPPRSGSTLLRVMLEGHDKLFSPPELDLLSFNTLGDRKEKLSGEYGLWLEATIRAVMELRKCSAEEAKIVMNSFEEDDITVKEFYGKLQSWAGDKTLVDKTPTYGLDINILNRAEEYFENPLFIHLTRNPYASIYSFIEAKLDHNFFRYEHNYNRQELAELIWTTNHKNILQFLANVPSERKIKITFEDLVTNSETEMKRLANFLKISYDERLIKPYEGKRMTDAVSENSQMVGDFKFYLRKKIDTNVTQRWKNFHREDFLGSESEIVATQLGYEVKNISKHINRQRNNDYKPIIKIDRNKPLPLSFAQQRLWFLEQLEPGKSTYNIPGVIKLQGALNISILEESINIIITRHESLRTLFITKDGKPQQHILEKLNLKINLIDISDIDDKFKEQKSNELLLKLSQKPFNFSGEVLIRCDLIKLEMNSFISVITMHHIISDGWSSEIFVRELAMIYKSISKNEKINLNEHVVNYVDYAAWQKEWLNGENYKSQISYWKNKLSDVPSVLELPTDFPRPPIQNQIGKRVQFELNSSVIGTITTLSAQENVTLYIVLFTAFNILMNKYSKSEDITIGTPVAGRNRSEIESLIGFFVNTLVLRNKLTGNPTIRQLLQSVKVDFLEAFNNQDVPFEKLVDELNIERSLSHTPLFQVMFVLNNSPLTNIEFENLSLQPLSLDLGTAKFDITFVLTKREERIRGSLEYDTSLFKEETIQSFIEHYQTILEIIANNPNIRLSDIELLNEEEIELIDSSWNNTEKILDSNETIVKRFEQSCSLHMDNSAVSLETTQLTFNELNSRANQVANYLLEKGVVREEIIGLYMFPCTDVIVAMLGILKAGCAYIALDPTYPSDRLEYMVADANIKYIFINNETLISEDKYSAELINLSEIHLIQYISQDNLKLNISPQNLAYIVYTSGSTGKPKGVAITHEGVINHLTDFHIRKPIEAGSRTSLWTSLNFDVSVYEIFYPLVYGSELCIIPEDLRLLDDELFVWLCENKIDNCYLPPFKIDAFANWLSKNADKCYLKKMLSGVESIKYDSFRSIQDSLPSIKILNGYGPAETTICSTVYEFNNVNNLDNAPIGKPMLNTKIYLLDKFLNQVPMGIPGEIFIESIGEARGYVGSPELTASKFIPNPFSKKEGKRFYKTGDLGKYLPDGNILFMGRTDNQIKLRGFRIELGEVENIILKYNGIAEIAVIIREDEPGNKKLVAYFISELNIKIDINDLKRFISEKLPSYMIPSIFMPLEKFPQLPNKKIDKKSFPKPEMTRELISTEFEFANSDVEKLLLNIWKDILRVEEVGINDNFFELGGDSILGIQVISKANQVGVKISPKNLFQFPTIKGLASVAGKSKAIVAEQGILEGESELSPIQHWFFEQPFEKRNHWNQSVLLEVTESLDKEILKETIKVLINHHDGLRLRFLKSGSNWKQEYGESEINRLFEYHIFNNNGNNGDGNLESEYEKVQESLNIVDGPLAKFVYYNLGANYNDRILIVAHHLVIDGVSWRIITEDIQKIYFQLKNGMAPNLPLKTTSYSYWTKSLIDYSNNETVLNELEYWKNQKILQDKIQTENEKSKLNIEESTIILKLELNQEKTNKLVKERTKTFNADIKEILITALVRANSRISGKRMLSITLEGHGREDVFDDVDISRTVGWFTTIYPVVLDLESAVSIADSVKIIKENLRKIPQNGFSYTLLKYLSNNIKVGDLPHLAEISFNYLGLFNQDSDTKNTFILAEENKGFERNPKNSRPFQMDVSCSIVNGILKMNWIYNTNKYSNKYMNELSTNFIDELENIIAESEKGLHIYSTSDFKEAELDENDLDSIFSELDEEFEDE